MRKNLPSPNISSDPSEPPRRLRISAVQMIFADSLESNLRKIERAARQATKRGADAILFPECATTGYAFDFTSLTPRTLHASLSALSQLAAHLQAQLLVGSPIFGQRKLYNALLVFDRSGRLIHTYAKCQLTPSDRQWFTPGNDISLFQLDGIPASAFICHERRYPELVRLPVMAGAQIVFHPNAGMDSLVVSRNKRGGRDGMAVRAFENAVYYIFANSVGPQGDGKWSAGDTKIVDPKGTLVKLADNHNEAILTADLDISAATRKYARESLEHPRVLARHWKSLLSKLVKQAREKDLRFQKQFTGVGTADERG